uniref:Uncharacterized protein n=1 Tax=Leersia perrieri TaxID=77586 RepID=A0A0D9XI54_9ORYZ
MVITTTSLGENFCVGPTETSSRTQATGARHVEAGRGLRRSSPLLREKTPGEEP